MQLTKVIVPVLAVLNLIEAKLEKLTVPGRAVITEAEFTIWEANAPNGYSMVGQHFQREAYRDKARVEMVVVKGEENVDIRRLFGLTSSYQDNETGVGFWLPDCGVGPFEALGYIASKIVASQPFNVSRYRCVNKKYLLTAELGIPQWQSRSAGRPDFFVSNVLQAQNYNDSFFYVYSIPNSTLRRQYFTLQRSIFTLQHSDIKPSGKTTLKVVLGLFVTETIFVVILLISLRKRWRRQRKRCYFENDTDTENVTVLSNLYDDTSSRYIKVSEIKTNQTFLFSPRSMMPLPSQKSLKNDEVFTEGINYIKSARNSEDFDSVSMYDNISEKDDSEPIYLDLNNPLSIARP